MSLLQRLALLAIPVAMLTACSPEQVQTQNQPTSASARASGLEIPNAKLWLRNMGWTSTTFIEVHTTKNTYSFNLLMWPYGPKSLLSGTPKVTLIQPVPTSSSISYLELTYDPGQRYYTYNNEAVTYIDLNRGRSSDDIKFKDGGDNITYKASSSVTGVLLGDYRKCDDRGCGIPGVTSSVADNDGIDGIKPARLVGSWNGIPIKAIAYIDITPM